LRIRLGSRIRAIAKRSPLLPLDATEAITAAAAALTQSQGTKTLTAAEVEAELRKVVGDF